LSNTSANHLFVLHHQTYAPDTFEHIYLTTADL